jgi:hypothetical protein
MQLSHSTSNVSIIFATTFAIRNKSLLKNPPTPCLEYLRNGTAVYLRGHFLPSSTQFYTSRNITWEINNVGIFIYIFFKFIYSTQKTQNCTNSFKHPSTVFQFALLHLGFENLIGIRNTLQSNNKPIKNKSKNKPKNINQKEQPLIW